MMATPVDNGTGPAGRTLEQRVEQLEARTDRLEALTAGAALAHHLPAAAPSWWPQRVPYRRSVLALVVTILGTSLAVGIDRCVAEVGIR